MNLAVLARDIEAELFAAGFSCDATQQALNLAEESGEFLGALRRWTGRARRPGSFDDVRHELADVVITAFVTAVVLDFDLYQAIQEKSDAMYARGWRAEG